MGKMTVSSFVSETGRVLKNYFVKMRLFFFVFALMGIFFMLFPQVDPIISGLFYTPEDGFYLAENAIPMAVYHGVNYLTAAIIAVFAFVIFYSLIKKRDGIFGLKRKTVIFMVACLIFSSGLVVNVLLKEGVGRPRPQEVTLFGGDRQFQPPFVVSNECKDNCSFVSGHASLGFYLMAFGLAMAGWRRKYLLAAGFAAGWLIGAVRIMQGRHFFTDVLFAFFFVYATLMLVYEFMYDSDFKEKES